MALNPEFGKTTEFIPHTNLRRESTVKKLLKEGRYPSVLVYFDGESLDYGECLIPGNRSNPPESFKVSREDARKIIAIRDKLAQSH